MTPATRLTQPEHTDARVPVLEAIAAAARELLATLPRCDVPGCGVLATHGHVEGRGRRSSACVPRESWRVADWGVFPRRAAQTRLAGLLNRDGENNG